MKCTSSPINSSARIAKEIYICIWSCVTKLERLVPAFGTPAKSSPADSSPETTCTPRARSRCFKALQVILSHIEVVNPSELNASDFLPQSVRDSGKLLARLREVLLSLGNPHLKALVECFLIDDEFVRKFTTAPAGIRNHHAYTAGLLEHVVTMLNVALRIADLYPEVDRDLLLCGIFVHDLGKIDELSYERTFGYTDEGQLVGHLVMGVAMLRDVIRKVPALTGEPFPSELRLRLEHMIVSHHGTPEFGAAKVPMTAEAIALHHIDNLDAKIHLFMREIRDDPSRESNWTQFHPNLGIKIFKGSVQQNTNDDAEA